MLITTIRKVVASFLALFLLLGVSLPTETHDVKDAENCKMNFTVLSDAHMEGNNKPPRDRFIQTLYDVKNCETPNDALVFLGDNTMNGQNIENLFFYGLIERIQPAESIYTAMGNHDTGNGVDQYDKLASRFWSYYNAFTGNQVEAPYYYSVKLDDCYFIFMASESDAVNSPDISIEQINWLDGVLTEAENDNLPAFVFNHHPYTHLIENYTELLDVLVAHHDVFYICGHTHTTKLLAFDFDYDSHYINLPKCTDIVSSTDEYDDAGTGIQVEIYDSQVVIRARRFYASEWLYEYDYSIN